MNSITMNLKYELNWKYARVNYSEWTSYRYFLIVVYKMLQKNCRLIRGFLSC
jgi:hypothetical protein